MTLKELSNLLPLSMYILSITLPHLSIPDAHFPVPLSTFIRSQFQVKPATLLIPINCLFLLLFVEGFYSTRYQSGFFLLIIVGSGFSPVCRFALLSRYLPNSIQLQPVYSFSELLLPLLLDMPLPF